jgi:hypothetical protein
MYYNRGQANALIGDIIPDLFYLEDEGSPVHEIAHEAEAVISLANEKQKQKLLYTVDAKKWRAWSNPEFLLRPFGLRLEEIHQDLRESILGVLRSSFSEAGYAKAIAAMRINHYLGELVQLPRIMNHYSYNFLIFGTPSTTEPSGWKLYGHHHCLNVILRGPQIVISPFFIGAEPNEIDEGRWIGTQILHKEGELGLNLMKSLPPSFQQQAQIYRDMNDAAMPEGRFQKDDQRHLCGAFRDNRVIPYEGFRVSMLEQALQQQVVDILYEFLVLLPASAREKKLEQARRWLDQTYFFGLGDIQTKILFIIEFRVLSLSSNSIIIPGYSCPIRSRLSFTFIRL